MRIGSGKKKESVISDEVMARKAAVVVTYILNVQRKWADWMQRQTERLSAKGKLFLLVIFCVATTTCTIVLVHRSIYKSDRTGYHVGKIQIPSSPMVGNENLPSRDIMERIKRFRQYMDSLSKDQNGIKTYDSILIAHPGLMDSLSMIEQLNK